MKLVNFKADPEDYLRWKEEARQEKLTFGEWARRRLNHAPAIAPAIAAVASPKASSKTSARTCDHRLPRGVWCKACQRIKT